VHSSFDVPLLATKLYEYTVMSGDRKEDVKSVAKMPKANMPDAKEA
jgi:hypothetical protein